MKKQLTPLGKAIEHYQAESAISCYRIAKVSGISEGTLSKLKCGITSPSLDTLERVAKVLDAKLSDIFKYKESLEAKDIGDSKNQMDLLGE